MPPTHTVGGIGRLIIGFGIVLIIVGTILILAEKSGFLGRLPGDIHIKRDGWSLWIPITTCIIISIVLTIILNLFWRRH